MAVFLASNYAGFCMGGFNIIDGGLMALPPARSCRSASRRAWAAPAGSLGSGPERIPASPRHLRPKPSTRRRNPDRRFPSAGSSAPRAADGPAAAAARAFRYPPPALPPQVSGKQPFSPLALFPTRPAATPTARCADPTFPTDARTASAAAWRSAATIVRSRLGARPAVRLWSEAARAEQEFPLLARPAFGAARG